MKTSLLFGLLLIAAGVAAQTPPQPSDRIEGQIYITRKDRETVKMSLVTVWIVHPTNYSAELEKVLSYKKAKENDTEWRERVTALVKAMPRMSATDRAKANQTYAKLRAQIITNTPFAQLGEKTMFELFSEMDWQPEHKTQTDADGNFNVEISAGRWKVVALARRKILDNDEEYIWMVDAPSSGRLLLNNSNLFGK